jgi:hypothetical protein
MKSTLALLIVLFIPFSGMAEKNVLPKNYMMEKHGISEPFYCDLEDPIEEIACMAWDAALGKHRKPGPKFDLNLVLEATKLIQALVSSGRESLYRRFFGAENISTNDIDICIVEKRGICGNHQDLIKKVLSYAGIPIRHIGIYYYSADGKRKSHAASEVFIGDKWRYVDVTWFSIWVTDPNDIYSLESFESVVSKFAQGVPLFRLSNQLDTWYQFQYEAGYDPFYYIKNPKSHIGIITDEQGTLTFSPNTNLGFQHIPNYVGTNVGTNTGITMKWNVPDQRQTLNLRLDVARVGGCYSNGPILLDDGGNEYPLQQGSNHITVPNGGSFNVKRKQNEICYIVFSDIAVIEQSK